MPEYLVAMVSIMSGKREMNEPPPEHVRRSRLDLLLRLFVQAVARDDTRPATEDARRSSTHTGESHLEYA
jgi:hypothetical protein